MKFIGNKKGVALVTSLMFTMLALVITMALLYMVTTGIKSSGALKRYKTVTEATYGGTEILVKDLITASFGYTDYLTTHAGVTFGSYMSTYMANLSTPFVSDCLQTKLTKPRSQWGAACSNATFDVHLSPDVTFNLNAASGTSYTVYSKIVDTMERRLLSYNTVTKTATTTIIAGNSDTSSVGVLEGGSTSEGTGITIPHYPYMYRIEIQGERQQNPTEKSNISVQYAY